MPKVEHPGKTLARFVEQFEITRRQLAFHVGYPYTQLHRVYAGYMGISNRLALLLAQAFGTSPEFWAHLQAMWDLEQYRKRCPPRRIERFPLPDLGARALNSFDQCLCGHWGHEHIDYPDGGCVHTELGVQCTCPTYVRLGGYIAHQKWLGGRSIKEQLEELASIETAHRG